MADRGLDARIAERCFGWVRHGQPRDYDGQHGGEPLLLPPGVTLEQQLSGFTLPPKGKVHIGYFVPPYSDGWGGAIRLLDDIHTKWVFSKRSRFYEALAARCTIDARPAFHEVSEDTARALQSSRVAWPYALGHFRNELPEFICMAALDATVTGDGTRPENSKQVPNDE